MNTAHEFFLEELHDIYNAEKRLVDVLREGEQQAERSDLKKGLAKHRKQTEGHVRRLEKVFQSLDEQPQEKECEGLSGLLQEKESADREELSPELRDFNSICANIKVERYEMSAYEGLIFLAQQMKHREAVALLKENLKEEQETSKALQGMMKETDMDWEAGMEEEEEEGESGEMEESEDETSAPAERRPRRAPTTGRKKRAA